MAIFEMLKHEMFEEIRVKVCDFLINDCDICPAFISSRCQEPCNDRNDKETGEGGIKTMTIFERLKHGMFDDMSEEANTPDDAPSDAQSDVPKGWIKLKMEAIGNDVYINTSTIVGVSVRNAASEALTEIYTIGAEDNPWLVEERIDEIIEKIKKA